MSLTTAGKFTIGGTLISEFQSSVNTDLRLYDNESTYIGSGAATNNLYGIRNTIIGYDAGLNSRVAGNNVVLGSYAAKNLNGQNNVVVGADTGRLLDNSADNIVIGKNTLQRVSTCSGNVAIGSLTGYNVSDGDFNVLIGHNVFTKGHATCVSNTVIGSFSEGSGYHNNVFGEGNYVVGSNNLLLGNQNRSSSSDCIILGYGNSNTGVDSIIIGKNITNSSNNVVNINNQIKSYERDVLTINNGENQNCAIQLSDSNIHLRAFNSFNVACPTVFEDAVVSNTVMDVRQLNVSAVCCMSSNIEMKSDDTVYWKIGLTNKTPESSDLSFVSKNKTFFTITDDFKPEILNFTGKHRCKLHADSNNGEMLIGMVVVANGEYCNLDDQPIIGIDESIPVVEVAVHKMDPRAFGVLCAVESEEDTMRSFNLGNIRFNVEKHSSRIIVNSVGEGSILVCNENGVIKNGDLLTTSGRYGYAMKQLDNRYMSYTVAKSTCDCLFHDGEVLMIGCTYKF
jgi:hypothetical protein